MEWVEGKRLQGGQYIIEKVLGRGGCGITYLATTSSGLLVAIKTVNKMVQDSRNFAKCQQEFENEARRLHQCEHSHIVSVHDLFLEEPLWCMVMEYIWGETLASYVDREGILSEADALQYIWQIGEALIEVHNNGLLHRDVKPRNIMRRYDRSEAVLIDFGAAREFTYNHTQTHTDVVSHGFAPLEQYFKRRKRGEYTDVYATAATLYFMVTGIVPPTALDRDDGERLVPPKQLKGRISDRVNEAILKGMALKASDRPQSMQEWLKLLERPEVITPPTVEPDHKVEVISSPVPRSELKETIYLSVPPPQLSKPDTRNTKIIPWGSLIIVFITYVQTGWLLAFCSAPLWVLAVSGSVAMALAGAAAVVVMILADALTGAGAKAVAMAKAVAVAVAVVVVAVAVNMAVVMAVVVVAVAVAVIVSVTRDRLLQSFSRFHTFLILAATSELSLGVGWLVYLMIFAKR
ncbi:serine/threonine protein kinase [Tolypothrix campylonemoides VB511288]|nr:serine/threonine protein kinase [Tolypothrix campylonemoides VB511288]